MGNIIIKHDMVAASLETGRDINSPLYYLDKLVFPTSDLIDKFIEYSGENFRLKINLITFDFYLEVYGFPILGKPKEFKGIGLVGGKNIPYSLTNLFSTLVNSANSIYYVGDTLAICGIFDNYKDYIVRNGIKNIVVFMPNSGEFNLVLPPSTEHTHIHNIIDVDKLNIVVPKSKFTVILNDLTCNFIGLKEKDKLDIISKYGITLKVY